MHLLRDTGVHFENKRVSRLFFVFLWLMYAVVYMTKNCFSGALAKIVEDGALTLTEAGIINSVFYFVYAPLQVIGGIFADKYSPEKLISVGLFGSAVSNLVIYFNQSFTVMLISWIFNAIIQFALWPSVFKIISSQLVRSDRTKMVFFLSFAMSGGLVFAYLVAAFVTRWQDNFLISSISLTALAILLIAICKRLDPLLKKDKVEKIKVEDAPRATKTGTRRILISSGFLMMLIAMFFCSMVESSVKGYSATMLNQSYESISPTVANLLGVLIIIAGILGILLIKFLLFPRIIKSEFVCYLVAISLSLPFLVVLQFLGKTPLTMAVISLCIINMFITAGDIMSNYFIVRFSRYGMNGTAVGLINSAAAFGYALQYCLFGVIADGNGGWHRVVFIWLGLIVAAVIALIFGIKPSIRFSKSEE